MKLHPAAFNMHSDEPSPPKAPWEEDTRAIGLTGHGPELFDKIPDLTQECGLNDAQPTPASWTSTNIANRAAPSRAEAQIVINPREGSLPSSRQT